MARRMVRHYVGNRSDLINAGVKRIIEKFQENVDSATHHAAEAERFNIAFNYIFSEEFNSLPATRLVAALLPVGLYDNDVQLAVKSIYDFFQASLEKELKQHKPRAEQQAIQQVAYTIMCLSFGGGWMRNIGFDPELNQKNKKLANALVNELS